MHISTALNHRNRATRRMYDLYSMAKHGRMTHAAMLTECLKIKSTINHCPAWVCSYVDGVESVLREMQYRNDLEYCSRLKSGEIVSHHSDSDRYYQKKGYEPREISIGDIVDIAGHFWKNTDKLFFGGPPNG